VRAREDAGGGTNALLSIHRYVALTRKTTKFACDLPHSIERWPLAAVTGVVVVLGAAVGLVVWEPWHGPVILSLSSGHGITTGNLLAAPLVALAICIGRVRRRTRQAVRCTTSKRLAGRWVGPGSAIALGVLFLLVGIVNLVDRGPLVPAGGGTFDGTVRYVGSRSASPVNSWSHIAMTYDGATLRLFMNGTQVSSQATTGTIQSTTEPLWIGGNHPYGEYFEGVIDEARVYSRITLLVFGLVMLRYNTRSRVE
jgi:hypothetical protein